MVDKLTTFNIVMRCVAVVFFVVSTIGSVSWYAKRQGISFKAAFMVLWKEGIVGGFKRFRASFVPAVKYWVKVSWKYVKRFAAAFAEYIRPVPVKHIFTADLYYGLYEVIREYVYSPFQPVIDVRYTPCPSCVYVTFYTKSAITPETAAEIVWHLQAKFQEYQTYYGMDFDSVAVPYVQDNRIEVYLYYCETPAEYMAFRECCHRAMLMMADPSFRPLLESEVPKVDGFALGYDYEQWRSAGHAVPFLWDTAAAPHMMVSGPTGGGKTVFVKVLLEQLLREGAAVTVCDFKGFGDLRGLVNDFASGKDCNTRLADFCAEFEKAREQDDIHARRRVLIFDEFGSFAASKSKKEFDELMQMISNLIFMGRSYGYHIILVAQRFDATIISTNLREQFGVKIYMGASISVQAATMLFPNTDLDKSVRLPPYCGYISTPKTDNSILIMPKVDISVLDRRLKTRSTKKGK